MKKNSLKIIILLLLLLIPIIYGSAQIYRPPDYLISGGTGGGGTGRLEQILIKIKDALKTLGYVVCAIFIIVGGYQMITASGDPQKFETGKRTLLFAAIGFIIILAADKIVNFLRSIVQ